MANRLVNFLLIIINILITIFSDLSTASDSLQSRPRVGHVHPPASRLSQGVKTTPLLAILHVIWVKQRCCDTHVYLAAATYAEIFHIFEYFGFVTNLADVVYIW